MTTHNTNSKNIMRMVKNQIVCDLTVGLEDNDIKRWSKKDISEYMNLHKDDLQKVVDDILNDSEYDPEDDLIREYICENFPEHEKLIESLLQ